MTISTITNALLILQSFTSYGDMCNNFCVRELSESECAKGPYCKNNYDCHSLFWTESSPRICVFTGSGTCRNVIPVLCSEAESSSSTGLHASATEETTRVAPVVETSNVAAASSGVTDHTPGTVFMVHTSQFEPSDSRPRILARFLGLDDIARSLLFVTGSAVSKISRAGSSTGFPESAGGSRVTNTIQILALEEGGEYFAHEIEMNLIQATDGGSLEVGLLGAAPTSHFAQAARIFAYKYPETLLIGETNGTVLNSYCEDGQSINYFPTNPSRRRDHWVVSGSVSLESGLAVLVDWVVDTGTSGLYVPSAIFESVVAHAQQLGTVADPFIQGRLQTFTNCGDTHSKFPTVSFSVGWGSDQVTVTMHPYEYASPSRNGGCFITLSPQNTLTGMPDARVLGIAVMEKLLVVFDQEQDRIGVCRA